MTAPRASKATKKAQPAAGKVELEVVLTYVKDTKTRHRYDAPDTGSAVGSLYLDQAMFQNGAPATIKVIVTL